MIPNDQPQPAENDLLVYLDGQFVRSHEASISIFDHAVLYGDGVFDTICAWNGYLFQPEAHVDRLLRSARATKMNLDASREEILEAVYETVRRNGLKNAYVKILVTRGSSPEPLLDPRECRSSLIVFARPFLWLISPEKIETGIRVKIVSTRRIPPQCLDPKIKSLNYQNNAMAKIEAIEAGADEAVMLDLEGFLCEGPTYNLFLVKGSQLYTPQDNILLGITRHVIFELAAGAGYPSREGRLTPYDLYNADEAFFCSTAGGIIPIVEADGRRIGAGKPGAVTKELIRRYFSMLENGEGGVRVVD